MDDHAEVDVDVAVVGAGVGGLCATYRLTRSGFTVRGFEGAPDVGGVWYHNRYPGARVDVESRDYAYFFDAEFYRSWRWSERYAAQPEILAYLQEAADRFELRRHYRFDTWVTGAQWEPDGDRYRITTDDGRVTYARFLVMTTGQLSRARKPSFPGLDSFEGRWVQTSHWPERDVDLEGKRVAVIGTGASGVQVITALAPIVSELVVFQRTPNYSVPAQNGPPDPQRWEEARADPEAYYRGLTREGGASHYLPAGGNAADYTPEQRRELLERHWSFGGHSMNRVFADQFLDVAVNEIVADFVREKIREKVKDPRLQEKLTPRDYPIGVRRLIVDTGYFEVFNRDNVELVDLREERIETITPSGIRTSRRDLRFDVLVFALGFDAFVGALDEANIRNEHGRCPTDYWKRGPRTYLGLMLSAFPNLFVITGPQSPSVLANMMVSNAQHVELVDTILVHMRDNGLRRVAPTPEAEDAWVEHTDEVTRHTLRRQFDSYMVHVNDDGGRMLIPYGGGLDAYVRRCSETVANGFAGFAFRAAEPAQPSSDPLAEGRAGGARSAAGPRSPIAE